LNIVANSFVIKKRLKNKNVKKVKNESRIRKRRNVLYQRFNENRE